MLDQYVSLGQRVELETVARNMADGEVQQVKKVYSSKVYDILSQERLEILMPYEQRKLVLLPVDSEYTMYFYIENGIFECSVRIVDRYKTSNTYILVVELLTPLRKYQRREFYRYNCALELETRELDEEEPLLLDNPLFEFKQNLPLEKSVIVDISGGGLRFIAKQKYKEGALLYCKYCLINKEEKKVYEIVGKVLHVMAVEKRPGCFEHRIQYYNIDNRTREEIIRYIFEEERKNRKKEKGLSV